MAGDERRATGAPEVLVELRFQPVWLYVDAIREFCGELTNATFSSPATATRVSLVVHELVENAIKYSPDVETATLELVFSHDGAQVQLSVSNLALPAQIERFREAFARVNAGDPLETYAAAMQRARSLPATESGLGLPRVRYEGRMTLSLATEEGSVRVTAIGDLEPEPVEPA